jgi:heptaprenyl diphosphate synthase
MAKKKTLSVKRMALYGFLIALGFVLGYVESLVPIYLGAPGVKLGLANLAAVIALYSLGVKAAAFINIARILLVGFTFGNMASILFGLTGAAFSLFVMAVCRKCHFFSMVGVSVLGGVCHNIGQFLIAAYVVKTFGVFSYLPVLLIAGTIAGALIGLLGGLVLERIRGAIDVHD